MAVSRSGTAYVLYKSGDLFAVSTVDASCQATSFPRRQQGLSYDFGMGFTSNAPAAGETLYVVSSVDGQFGSIDTGSYVLTVIGSASTGAELAGSASGALYAFYPVEGGMQSVIALIDKTSGKPVMTWTLPLTSMSGYAFVEWGGDFYTFTGSGAGATFVNRFDPTTSNLTQVGAIGEQVVGAGVSTCAP
jgi:hypothetical protein